MKYLAPIIFFFFSLNTIAAQADKQIYMEFLGNGILIHSLNYDQRLTSSVDGLGFRVGVSIIYGRPSNFTFPIMLNYLVGEKHQLEIGAGILLLSQRVTFSTGSDLEGIAFSGSVMYRLNFDNGWVFRIGSTPTFDKFSLPYWAGISMGRKF